MSVFIPLRQAWRLRLHAIFAHILQLQAIFTSCCLGDRSLKAAGSEAISLFEKYFGLLVGQTDTEKVNATFTSIVER